MSKNLANFIDGALTLGRTPHHVVDMLNADELVVVFQAFVASYKATGRTQCFFNSDSHVVFTYDHYGPLTPAEHKIHAIKRVRTLTGLGLKEAKDFVEGARASFDVVALSKLIACFGKTIQIVEY